jgi:hypothetical protein
LHRHLQKDPKELKNLIDDPDDPRGLQAFAYGYIPGTLQAVQAVGGTSPVCTTSSPVSRSVSHASGSDRCGLALLLARMPWNRGDAAAAAC